MVVRVLRARRQIYGGGTNDTVEAAVRRAFPSLLRCILPEICLYPACSYQEILRAETPGQAHKAPTNLRFLSTDKEHRCEVAFCSFYQPFNTTAPRHFAHTQKSVAVCLRFAYALRSCRR
eukprot:COSAG01_NODE_3921_length_5535_cov_44.878933_5_plen_120_part_00